MKFAIFKLFCALNWCTLAWGAAIFENTVDAPGSGYAYVKPSAPALLYPQERPIAPNRAGFDVSKHAAQQTRRPLPQYNQYQPNPAVEAQQRLDHQQQALLTQQQLDKQLEQDVLTAKRVSALQAVAFFGREAEATPSKPAPSSGYDYKRPGTTFEYPRESYELGAPNELEQQFEHHEVASEHKARRCGPVKRIRVNQPTLLDNAVSTSDDEIEYLKAIVAERSQKRPTGRRLIPYTETLADASYFVQ